MWAQLNKTGLTHYRDINERSITMTQVYWAVVSDSAGYWVVPADEVAGSGRQFIDSFESEEQAMALADELWAELEAE